ncbi:ankyrin repeat domain-containing protein 45 isoform X3 [Macaca nemestrina]|uniref:ankyrin repeat domain-containing protein 45 isoform X3 n=1 Tax=Macaca nemestrina TaxID=9545 RepID=UPI0039B8F4FD
MESEGPPESESSEFFSQQEEEDEEEEVQEPEETGPRNPLLQPALTGDVEGLQKIFEDPENPHHEQAMQLLLEEDIVGRNLLYAACMAGQSDVIRALAKYGVNLNEKTTRGYTLLHCAAAWGRLETLKALVELDVDIEALNFREERARDVAARYSQTECVEFLDWAAFPTLACAWSHLVTAVPQASLFPRVAENPTIFLAPEGVSPHSHYSWGMFWVTLEASMALSLTQGPRCKTDSEKIYCKSLFSCY